MPYIPSERQYRNFAATNFQPVVEQLPEVDGEQEREAEPSYRISGYFTTFNDPYPLFDGYYEEVDPHAFDECDMSDVILQCNHAGLVYSRNRNGSLKLSFDSHGGHMEADLSGSKQGREDIYEMVSNGLIDTMSFGFTIADDGWEWTEDEDGVIHTRITKISKLFDVSVISGFAANPGTEVSARALYDAAIEARSKMAQAADEAAQEAARAAEETEREQLEEQERIAAQTASQRRKRMAAALRLASM